MKTKRKVDMLHNLFCFDQIVATVLYSDPMGLTCLAKFKHLHVIYTYIVLIKMHRILISLCSSSIKHKANKLRNSGKFVEQANPEDAARCYTNLHDLARSSLS